MSLNTLVTFVHTFDPALLVLGGMLTLLSLAISLTLSRLIRAKIAHLLSNSSDGKSP